MATYRVLFTEHALGMPGSGGVSVITPESALARLQEGRALIEEGMRRRGAAWGASEGAGAGAAGGGGVANERAGAGDAGAGRRESEGAGEAGVMGAGGMAEMEAGALAVWTRVGADGRKRATAVGEKGDGPTVVETRPAAEHSVAVTEREAGDGDVQQVEGVAGGQQRPEASGQESKGDGSDEAGASGGTAAVAGASTTGEEMERGEGAGDGEGGEHGEAGRKMRRGDISWSGMLSQRGRRGQRGRRERRG